MTPGRMNDAQETVLLVDADDRPVGSAGKLAAHSEGLRHRALSVIVSDGAGRMLLQKRAAGKYHSAGLWTNTCCSHPRLGETIEAAAARRLEEEMGFRCPLRKLFVTSYRGEVGQGCIEDEVVHVFGGRYEGPIAPDPQEVESYRWTHPEELKAAVRQAPEDYTIWFKLYIQRFAEVILDPKRSWRQGGKRGVDGPPSPCGSSM